MLLALDNLNNQRQLNTSHHVTRNCKSLQAFLGRVLPQQLQVRVICHKLQLLQVQTHGQSLPVTTCPST
jgi:hypothetical protein